MAGTYLDRVSNKALGQMLIEKGALSEAQVNEALEVSKRKDIRLGEALVSLGYIGRDALSYAIAEQYGQRPMELHPSMVDARLLSRFDVNFLMQHTMLPLIDLGSSIVVVVGDPNDQAGLDELARTWPGVQIDTQLAAPAQIMRCLENFRVYSSDTRFRDTTAIGSDSVAPRGLTVFDEPPSADSDDFSEWLLGTAAENWGRDIIIRENGTDLQVALEGETLQELGRWPGRTLLDVLGLVLLEAEPVPFTDARVRCVAPGQVNGHYYDFLLATPSTPGPGFAWIRALRRPDRNLKWSAPEAMPALPDAGRCTIVEHSGEDRLDLLIAQLAATHSAEHQILLISSGIRISLSETAVFPAPFTDVTAAALAHRATTVIFDYPPSMAEVSRLLASIHPVPPGVLVFVTEKESAAVEALISRPGTQRVKFAASQLSSNAKADTSVKAGKGNA